MGSGMTIDNFYESLTSRVGQDVVDAQNSLDQQTSVMNQLEDQRNAVSGVSLDEEMLNLIKYEAAYNAAGRLVATVNTMMGNLINLGIDTAITT
jgi:flagellar hook-associated protein 1 FlgK